MKRLLFLGLLAASACSRPEPAPAPEAPAPRPPVAPQLVGHATADHTCLLDASGAATCWGRNDHGQLGSAADSGALYRTTLSTRIAMVAVGGRHTCALDDAHVAWCWGANDLGQLGTSAAAPPGVPTRMQTERRFARLAAGTAHACALDEQGRAYCWGDNRWGQLGNGTRAQTTTPVAVATDASFQRLAAGSRHTCGVTAEGRALCWGDNFLGQLGQPRATQQSFTPVVVPGIDTVVAIAAGHGHTCALGVDGAAWCWGQNGIGQLGSGQPPGASTAVRVANTPPLADLRTGYHHTCAVDVDGVGWCWGANTSSEPGNATITGQLGSDVSWTNLPTRIELEQPLASFAPGDGHTCALTRAGVIYCFGSNRFGQVPGSDTPRALDPVRVMRLESSDARPE